MRKIFTKGLVATGATVAALAMTFAGGSVKANAQDAEGSLKISDIKYENSEIGTLLKSADKDKDGYLSMNEREQVTKGNFEKPSSQEELDVVLEVFPKIEDLKWNSGTLKTLDLKGKIDTLELYTSASSQVELKGNTENLKWLYYFTEGTQKYTFNGEAAGYIKLKGSIYLEGNQIEKITVSDSLRVININNTSVKTLSIHSAKNLDYICINTCEKMKSISISNCPKLDTFYMADTPGIKTILKSCSNLEWIEVKRTGLTKIGKGGMEITSTPKLELVQIEKSKVTSVDLSKITSIKTLDCSENKIKKLLVSKNKKLKSLMCKNNKLTSLDVSKCSNLEDLDCSGNQLKRLSVSKNKKLKSLDCSKNRLKKLSVSKNHKLNFLNCSKNSLKNVSLTKNKKLQDLNCASNKIIKLDFSKNKVLDNVNIGNNYKLLASIYKNSTKHLPNVVITVKKKKLNLCKYAPKLKKAKFSWFDSLYGNKIKVKKGVVTISSKANNGAKSKYTVELGKNLAYLTVIYKK